MKQGEGNSAKHMKTIETIETMKVDGKTVERIDGESRNLMEESVMNQPSGKWRRISAWIMLVLFVLLIFNILFFHILPGESAVMYVGLIVVFFLGNGMRGGVQPYGQQEQQEQQDGTGEDNQ